MELEYPRIPLEYWTAFKAVVDCGSYALAAEALNKSQSSVSYAIARLNEQLPRPVLALKGRRAELTEAGEVLYRHASQLIGQARTMEDLARSMEAEFEAEVTIALDILLQVAELACALEKFSLEFPHTRVRILETSLTGTVEALIDKQADLVIGARVPPGYPGRPLRPVRLLPVAAPQHQVFTLARVGDMELRQFRQVVVRDTGQRAQTDSGWLEAERRWTVSHFYSSISLVKSGVGFAFVPVKWIEEDLSAGVLREITMDGECIREVPLFLMHGAAETEGPATRALGQILAAELGQ